MSYITNDFRYWDRCFYNECATNISRFVNPEVGRSEHDENERESSQFEDRQGQTLNRPSNRICGEPKYLDYGKKSDKIG